MTRNELITIVLSAGALAVSLITLYFTYFHKLAGIVGVLIVINHEPSTKYDREFEYALSNTGNLQLILKEIEALSGESESGKKPDSYVGSDCESSDYPAVIEPGHVKLVRLRFNGIDIVEAKKDGISFFVSFTLISSKGKIYDLIHDLTPIDDEKTERAVWEPFKLKASHRVI